MQQSIIIILNTPLNVKVFNQIKTDCVLICSDGGANRIYDLDKEIIPNYIIGDLDSIRLDVKQYYNQKGCDILQEYDQDTSDFEKVLLFIEKKYKSECNIIIMGGLSERFDQTINSLHTLIRFKFRGQLISDYSILRYFSVGTHKYQFTKFEQKKGIGIFPGFGQARINSKGLKWNINQEQPLILGQFISTSNEAIDDQLEFEALDDFFLVTQLKDDLI